MTITPFVASLRSRPDAIRLCASAASSTASCITLRVEMPEVWDTVRVEIPPAEPVLALKIRALDALYRSGSPSDFVMKINGYEVLDENVSLTDAGARDGSTFLLTFRRRRPVRS